MNNNEELIKKANIQRIAEEGAKIYESIRPQYEPAQNGKFLAIDIDTKDVYTGTTSSEAVELARRAHPNKVFYVVKIGFSVAETLASLGVQEIIALVDTGFTGELKISPEKATELGLQTTHTEPVRLADEKTVNMRASLALVSMEGAANVVSVLIAQGMPIIGVSLLRRFGYMLNIDFKYNSLFLQK
jgi:clan AA aspartic protease